MSGAVYEDIIKYQNLKAVFLLFQIDKASIVSWCAAFPQTIDILRNEKLPDNTLNVIYIKRNILHYACMSQNSDNFKFLFNSTNETDVNYHYANGMTALDFAVQYDNIDVIKILISHGADVNNKFILFHFISIMNV
ncbi:hypothetical protein TVAG_253550 [Trichomonas vaginalis G3]|uniref:Uncharacterized protein n=1 Tax=Trichomonas vaginalis (strain ATCC PRA-98 / G3) TaxID=412133 RepID=A2DMM2_TRIV3|nr:spectrin binding [Trichomonas vaginalis G3]EAY18243.1 hypothetical protein TVAG_253550 [Trichomonas vaginalis G3]KAI5541936.1 spectrin binding [Trichomonas vaginalis G3]|eukprot:XP_001579229.1 hypothetical protein [Trichomonas vaginalis G3]